MANVCLKITGQDGKVREFRKNRVTARYIKEGFKLEKKLDKLGKENDFEGILDARVQFTVDFFDDENLTVDSIWDGLTNDELIPALDKVFNQIMGTDSEDSEPGES